MRIHVFWIEENCALKTLTLPIFKVFPHPSALREFPSILPRLQACSSPSSGCQAADTAWTCPVLLWEGWSLFWPFQPGSAPSALPFLFLWTSREGVTGATAMSSMAHPYVGNAGSQMPGCPCHLVYMCKEVFSL